MEHRGAGPGKAHAGRAICSIACASASRPAACCITARANGIRASRCRAGRLTCYWRTDGVPLWHDRALLARDEHATTDSAAGRAALSRRRWRAGWASIPSTSIPRSKIRSTICSRSASCRSTSIRWTTIWRTRTSASGCAASSSAVSNTPVGYRAAAAARLGQERTRSGRPGLWMLRGQHLFLMPGDSPVGLRLPLPSLPWVAPSEAPQLCPSIRW